MKTIYISSLLLGLLVSTPSQAMPGSLTYHPLSAATGVPTLSGIMLILLGLSLVIVAVRMLKQNTSGSAMLFGIIGVTALMSSGSGVKLLADAYATSALHVELHLAGGGTVHIDDGSVAFFENTSGVTQKISNIILPENCPNRNGSDPDACIVGLTLDLNDICFIDCSIPEIAETDLDS